MRWLLVAVNLITPLSAHAMSLLVDKSDRELYVIEAGKVTHTFGIEIGKNPVGHKRRAGDMRTPEGTYRLTRRYCATCRFKRAYALNYPNRQDRREGRTGSAILIHNGAGPFYWWTAGCIALSDADFDRLWAMVPDGAVIRITP